MISLQELNKTLVYDIWEEAAEIDDTKKKLLHCLINNYYKEFYGRKRRKEVIHIGLDEPSVNVEESQTLMFGPAGNMPSTPEIIITGISTSISAANEIARILKRSQKDDFKKLDLCSAYLSELYIRA